MKNMRSNALALSLLMILILIGFPKESSSGEAVKEVKIGIIQPLSGPLASTGVLNMKAYEFAVDEINKAGGIRSMGGAQIKILKGNSEGKPEVGMGEAERLIRDGAVVLMGAFQSSVTFTSSQIAEKNRIPYICPISGSAAIAKRGFKYLIKNSPDADEYNIAGFDFVKHMSKKTGIGPKTVALMLEDTLHGVESGKLIKPLLKKYNLELVEYITYPHKTSDLTAEIGKVKASKADMLLTVTYVADAILITKTMNKLRYSPMVYFSYTGGAHPLYAKTLGPLANGTFTNGEWSPLLKKKGVKELNENFKKVAGVNMDGFRAEIYTAVYVLKDALERAATLDKERIMEALKKTNITEHYMPYGRICFGENGKNPNVKPLVVEIRKGTYFPVFPSEYSAGEATWPFVKWEDRGL